MEEQPGQNERIQKVRVQVDDLNRLELIRMADARDLHEQMRKITARLGSSVIKVGKDELSGQKPE